MILKYFNPFLLSFFLSVMLLILGIILGKYVKWAPRRSKRHIHGNNILRIGGIAMIISFNVAILLNSDLKITLELIGFIIGSLILLGVGIWDDYKEIHWKIQLFFQVLVTGIIFIMGIRIYYITNPLSGGILPLDSGYWLLFSIGIIMLWIILVMNAMNWLDGIDGLSGGITLISAVTIFSLCFKSDVNQPPIAIMTAILIGSVLGFLIFNFNPARIFAGTSGAMFMGYSIAVLAIFSGTKIATALLVIALPVIDFFWVIQERWRNKKSIFKPDQKHLHFKLLEIGWSQRKINFYYYLITLIIAVIALNTRAIGKSITLLIVFIIMIFVSVIINQIIKSKRKNEE
jgi:UDP-GlcNAc:undecaprenyl-phosphate/decaprenyl-phosphate GlcNAc-1-phosphate transferase